MVTLLQKPMSSPQETEGNSFEASQQQTFGQALVFTNSQHSNQMASGTGSSSAVNSYSPQSLVKLSYAFYILLISKYYKLSSVSSNGHFMKCFSICKIQVVNATEMG